MAGGIGKLITNPKDFEEFVERFERAQPSLSHGLEWLKEIRTSEASEAKLMQDSCITSAKSTLYAVLVKQVRILFHLDCWIHPFGR